MYLRTMVKIHDLSHTYNVNQKIGFPDFSCAAKEILLVLGTSGVGKTTLLHLLSGLLTIQKGEINIGGTDIKTLSSSQLDAFRGQNIGIIFQQNHFVDSLSVVDNIILAQTLAGQRENVAEAKRLLGRLNIADKADKKIRFLSQGEKQRVAIARAIINKPKLILADEPTSALDDVNTVEVLKLLTEQANEANSALIIVTHDTRLKDQIANQVILS
jgi:ABC-type lipoprotein export system ATPase subunit